MPNTPARTIALDGSVRCGISHAATSATNEPSSASDGRGTERRRSAPSPKAASVESESATNVFVERWYVSAMSTPRTPAIDRCAIASVR